MGSWNKTCGISGLPIYPNEKVIMFVVIEQQYPQRDLATSFWRPVLYPIDSLYADYGKGTNNRGLSLVIDMLRPMFVKRKQGSNKYREPAVEPSTIDDAQFFSLVSYLRLLVAVPLKKERLLVDFVMFKQRVVDSICQRLTHKSYFSIGQGIEGMDKDHVTYTYQNLVAQVPLLMAKFTAHYKQVHEEFEPTIHEPRLNLAREFLTFLHEVAKNHGENTRENAELATIASYLIAGAHTHQLTTFFKPFRMLEDLIYEGKSDEATQLIQKFLLGVCINNFLIQTRKQWMPGCYEGSQQETEQAYRVLGQVLIDEYKKEEAKRQKRTREWAAEQ